MNNFKKTAETFEAGYKTLPAKFYLDENIFEEEKIKILKMFWTCIGHIGRIPKTGDYFVEEAFGESLIVVRDSMEMVRVFYNSCRHRGAQICSESYGHVKGRSIQCNYHGWTYSLDGKLIGAPFMKEVKGFDWSDNGLFGPHVYIWEGFIFVNFLNDPYPFEELYAPMLGKLAPWSVGSLSWYGLEDYEVDANWKLIFQNFNECYHCPTIHPMLNKYTNYTSAENDLSEGPFLGGYMGITGGESMTMSGKLCGQPLGSGSPETTKKGYYYTLLGNLLLNIHPDYVMFHLLFPQSVGKTRIESSWMFSNRNAESRGGFNPSDAVEFWQITNKQDWEICEQHYRGLSSKGYREGWYSPRESLLIAFDKEYKRLME